MLKSTLRLLLLIFGVAIAKFSYSQCSVPSGTGGATSGTYAYTVLDNGSTHTFTFTPDATTSEARLYINNGYITQITGTKPYVFTRTLANTPALIVGNTVTFYLLYTIAGQEQTKTYSYIVGNCATVVAPTTAASNITFTSKTATGMTINCTSGNGSSRLIVVKQGSAVDFVPVDGSTYTANTDFSQTTSAYLANGTANAAGTNKIVYAGSSNTVSITGLTASTVYYVTVFEYNGTTTTTKHLTTSAPIANTTTPASSPTITLNTPTAGTYLTSSSISFNATATPSSGTTISTVHFYANNGTTNIVDVNSSSTGNPYTYTWSSPVVGTYTVTAVATDNLGTTVTSTPVSITVANASPTLTAASGATVDNNFNITFTDDATWRAAITAVKYGSTTLTPTTDYTISAGILTLKPSGNAALRVPGTQTVTVIATGYTNATVSQAILAGVATKLGIKTQPALAISTNSTGVLGSVLATQPAVYIQDQYGNTTSSTATVTATTGAGSWAPGGNTTSNGVSGTATFSGLSATGTVPVQGATITFTSPGLTSITSNSFNIPGPPVAGWCGSGGNGAIDYYWSASAVNSSGINVTWIFHPVSTRALNATAVVINQPVGGTISFSKSGSDWTGTVYNIGANSPLDFGFNVTSPSGGSFTTNKPTHWYTVSTTASCTYYVAPTVAASNIAFPAKGTTGMTISWTNGNGTTRLVVVRAGNSAVNFTPVDGTTYTANTVYSPTGGLGASADNRVVYNGTGSTVNITGLTAGQTYQVTVYEFNGAGTSSRYLTTGYPGNSNSTTTSLTAPTVSLTSPIAGATYYDVDNITLSANAASSSGTIDHVQFYQNGILIPGSADYTSPYSYTWSGMAAGSYAITANAIDNQTTTTSSSAVNITVIVTPPADYCGSGGTNGATPDYYYKITSNGNLVTYTFHPVNRAIGSTGVGFRTNLNGTYRALTYDNTTGDWVFANEDVGGNTTITLSFQYTLPAGGGQQTPTYPSHTYTKGVNCVYYATPTTPASNITFPAKGTTSFTINWTSGNGSNRLVVIRAVSAVDFTPVDGTDYTANAVFTSGTGVGTSGTSKIVYTGTGSTVDVSGLTANTLYYVTVYEFNGITGYTKYLTTGAPTASTTTYLSAPTVTLTSPSAGASYYDVETVPLSATASSSTGTIASVQFYANNGTTNTLINTATSSPYNFSWTGMAAGTYTLTARAIDNQGSATTSAGVNITVKITPPADYCGSGGTNGATPDYYYKITSNGNLVTYTFHPVNRAIGSTGVGFRTNLNGTYRALTYDNTTGDWVFANEDVGGNTTITLSFQYTLPAGGGQQTPTYPSHTYTKGVNCVYYATPTTPASNITFPAKGTTSFTINWTSGNGSNRLVVIRAVSAVDFTPVDGTDYTANAVFTSGTGVGTSGTSKIVYTGTGSTVDVSGLTANTLYYVTVYEFNGITGYTKYLTTGAPTASTTTYLSAPTVTLTSPSAGASYYDVETVPLSATASSSTGTIASVQFYANNGTTNTLINTATSSPYNFSWTGMAAGTYTLTARAIDNQGSATTSAGVNITVKVTPPVDYCGSGGTNGATPDYYYKITSNGNLVTYTFHPVNRAVGSTGVGFRTNLNGTYRALTYDNTTGDWVFANEDVGGNTTITLSFQYTLPAGGGQQTPTYPSHTYTKGVNCVYYVAPATAASNITFPAKGTTTLTINWTKGSGSDRLVVVRQGSPVDFVPADNNDYTTNANANFSAGTTVGTGCKVVYSGTGNTVNVTGLTIGTLYYVTVYEFNGYSTYTRYLKSGAPTANITTYSCAASTAAVLSGTATICTGGYSTNLSVTVTGGSSPFTVVYNNGAGNVTINNYTSGDPITVTPSGNTTYSLVSVNGSCGIPGTGISGTATVTLVPPPTLSSSLTPADICSGATFGYTAASATSGTTFSWTRAAATGISNSAGSGSSATVSEVLINTTADPADVVYVFTMAANGCTNSQNVTVTVNPRPTLSSSLTPADICSGTTFTYTATSATSGTTFSWTRAVVSGISNSAGSGNGANISEVLTNTTTSAKNVVYVVTSLANSCSNPQNVTVIVLPAYTPTVSIAITLGSNPTCQGGNVTFTATPVNGGTAPTYQWYKNGVAVTGNTTNTYTATNINTSTPVYVVMTVGTGICVTTTTATSSTTTLTTKDNSWTGAVSTTWGTPANWCSGSVPGVSTNIVIPTGLARYPVLNNTYAVHDIEIQSGATVSLNDQQLTISGIIEGTGKFKGTPNSKLVISTPGAIGTLYMDPAANTLGSLKQTTALSTLTLGNPVGITGELNVGNTTLNTGGNLTLRSNVNGTAWVAPITGSGSITGSVTVERYMPYYGHRAWMMLAVPTGGSQTINAAWQEGAASGTSNPNPGYGTLLTKAAANPAAGYDATTAGNSLLILNTGVPNATGSWAGVTTSLLTTPVATTSGYMVYMRGDRSAPVTGGPVAQGPVTLRTSGSLYQGTQTAVPVSGSNNTLIGNIYASAVDYKNLVKTGLAGNFKLWDPKLGTIGGYQTFTDLGAGNPASYTPSPGGGSYGSTPNTRIESGQAFIVQGGGGGGSIQFTEAARVSGSNNYVFRGQGSLSQYPGFKVNLEVSTASGFVLADGNSVYYNDAYSDAVNNDDATKVPNFGENFGILKDGHVSQVETRRTMDSIVYQMTNLQQQQYRLQFIASGFETGAVSATLVDNFLHTATPVSLRDTVSILFKVTTDAGSSEANRFKVVFKNSGVSPVKLSIVKAYRNDDKIKIEWNINDEHLVKQYEIESSTDGQTFEKNASIMAKGMPGEGNYSWTDEKPFAGDVFYRIKSIVTTGEKNYSAIAKIDGLDNSGFNVSPNPVTGNTIKFQMKNQPAGKYTVRLLNAKGQTVLQTRIDHAGASDMKTVALPSNVLNGVYQLELISMGEKRLHQTVIISKGN